MTVVILARPFDPTADAVVTALGERGVPVFRTDLSAFPSSLRLNATLVDGTWGGDMWNARRSVRLADIRSIWYRNPSNYRFNTALTEAEHEFCYREAKLGLGGVLCALDVLWANPMHSCAVFKPFQWRIAAECGLRVADTVITNDADSARAFAADPGGDGVVTKALGPAGVTHDGTVKVAYTRQLTTDDLAHLDGVTATATTLQTAVPKDHEVRLTTIGSRWFPIALDAGSARARQDWRSDPAALRYTVTDVPRHVAQAVSAYLRRMNLAYSGMDFVVTPDGEWVMLEFTDRPVLRTSRSWRPVSGVPADRLPARSGTSVLFRWLDGACGADGVGRGSEGSGDHPRQGLAVVDGAVARGCSARAGRSVPAAA